MANQSFYSFSAQDISGKEISMESFKGKTILVVNTASKCGLTPQFEGLEKLYQTYKDKGLVILGFPCNQFANQEPGEAEEIASFCQKNYGVSFPMFDKIDVNGEHTHPIFKYLKNEQGGFLGSKIKWNFTKFLIDKNGQAVDRYAPQTEPASIARDIEKIL